MEEIADTKAKITAVEARLAHIKSLWETKFESWSDADKQYFGTEDDKKDKQQLMKKEEQLIKEKEQLIKEKEQLREQQNLLLKLQLQEAKKTAKDVNAQVFLLTGYIEGSKGVKGIRQRLYRLANLYLAYYDGDEPAFEYEGDNLRVHLLFDQQSKALEFDSAVNEEKITDISPLRSINFNLQINGVYRETVSVRGRVYGHHYNPDESDSPQEVLSMVSGITIIKDDSPIFKYQRLESASNFGGHYRADRAHLIDKAFCQNNQEYAAFNNDENNFLALSADVRNWFDGINCDLPLFMLEFIDSSRRPIANEDERFEVTLNVYAWDREAARMLFPRLNEGAVQIDSLTMQTRVYVKNKDTFKRCIEWKASKTRSIWNPDGGID